LVGFRLVPYTLKFCLVRYSPIDFPIPEEAPVIQTTLFFIAAIDFFVKVMKNSGDLFMKFVKESSSEINSSKIRLDYFIGGIYQLYIIQVGISL
jgi:hypothetical protein